MKVFYDNRNKEVHLRGIARSTKMNESSITRHLNNLVKNNMLKAIKEGNLKKFSVNKKYIPKIFPLFDYEKLEGLPLLRKSAIKMYIEKLEFKPVLLVVFGSTAKETYKEDSDIDILEIIQFDNDNKKVINEVEAQTMINIQTFRLTEKEFNKEMITKEDKVVQSAMNTGFPVFNEKYYYEVMYNERRIS